MGYHIIDTSEKATSLLQVSAHLPFQKVVIHMTQDELWLAKWQEAIDFLETNHRKPSKFIPEERNMRSWWKHNKKLMNAGEMKEDRLPLFKILLNIGEKYRRVNQYE